MVYTSRIRGNADRRPQAFWGAFIPAAINFVGGLITSSQQAKAQKRALEEQQRLAQQQLNISNQNQLASTLNNYASAQQSYDDKDYNLKYRIGGVKRLGGRNIMITDGGNAKRIGNNTYLLRGGSHEDINETGQTGIGINVGGNEIEAEGGEVAQRKGNSLRIYSAQPILGGMSPAQAIMRGYNKDKVFNAQQRFKKNNGIKDDGSKAQWGMGAGTNRALQKSTKNGTRSIRSMWNSAKGPLSYTPIVGTTIDGYNLINNPSKTNAANFGVSLISDLLGYKWLKQAFNTPVRRTVNFAHRGRVPSKVAAATYSGAAKGLDTEMNYFQNRKRYGGLTSKDRGSSKHPYPSVASKDFAGGNRSYPIPTKADAIDALRLAGLHGRSDVRSKVYSKYPELRKKAENGTSVSLTSSYGNKDFLHRITQGHPTARKIVNEIFGDEADRRRVMQDLNIFGLTSDDASGIAGASPIFRQPIINAARQAQFIQDANKARQAANANKARQAANYAQQQIDYIKELSDRMSATMRNVGEQLGIRVNPNPNNSVRRLYSSNFKPTKTNNRITAPRETPMNPSNSSMETPINSTTTSATNTRTYSGKTTKFNTKYRSYRNAGFSPRTSKNLVKANKLGLYSTIGGFGAIGAGTLIGANINRTNKANKAQLDAKGQPISPYIAKPQEPVKPQVKKSVPARKDTIATKPATRQVPASVAHKDTTRTDTTRTDTTKQVNKVVKRQVRTTPQYTGNTTKGNYQLHNGETKVINGVKYTRRGNTIINHKTNVGYIYDKNGNYTGQADYSKVGNFNQAFDAARAAGRNQFIYRAGKYNNYSTVKETNAKKERLNRIVGARRIAKKMGGLTNPPVGSRKKYLPGGTANPWDEYRFTNYPTPNTWNERYGISNVPDYGGTAPWQVSNKYAVNVPHPISKFDLPITTITAKKDTFNDEMSRRMRAGVQNLKDSSDNTTVPYLGKQSSFSPKVQDYIGLGVDTLAALGSGIFTRSAYNKMNFDYALPNYVDESPVAFDTTYHNEAQRANVERNRLNTRGLITGNTSSAQTALNLMQKTDTDAMMETNKLLDEKSNKEVELRNQNLANEQQVRARNAAARNQYYQNVAQIRNAALEAKNNMELAKAQSIGTDLSGLSQAYSNFANSVENRYNTRQNEAIIAATAKDPAVLSNAVQFGYNFSPEVLAAIYNSTNDDALKNLALSQLNSKNRRKYGIK